MAKDTRFKPGNDGGAKSRKEKDLEREGYIAQILSGIPPHKSHLTPIAKALSDKALRGDDKAMDKLLSLIGDIEGDEPAQGDSLRKRPIGNDNLPQACRALREALDIDIAVIVQRYEMGLPSSEAEQLLAKTSLAVRDSGLKGRAAQRGERIAKAWREAWEKGGLTG